VPPGPKNTWFGEKPKSAWFGGANGGPAQSQKAATKSQQAAEKKASCLSVDMMKRLDDARSKPLDERKKVFKDLQRELHPDKNIDQAEAAKLAFQKLMEQREPFLAS
jgi:hypothetical protein